ncbi:MAG: peptide-methionine (S)-S-oxide reductase MsrA [Hyphomonadaceae bacterium]|nr:peptide-methionine (S)-S-oxide reductase MsrA [Hyphomonadaceae bacterium]
MKIFVVLFALLLAACGAAPAQSQPVAKAAPKGEIQEAVFAGGCFWCVEHDFQAIPGVREVLSGYTGGHLPNPTYEDVITETTGHYEAVRVRFDAGQITYRQLVDRYWRLIDPTDAGGQFCDRGPSYRSAIFVTPAQRADAEASKAALIASDRLTAPVVTEVLPLARFYPAEEYHRDYAKKNAVRYNLYRQGCGRDARLRQVWRN